MINKMIANKRIKDNGARVPVVKFSVCIAVKGEKYSSQRVNL